MYSKYFSFKGEPGTLLDVEFYRTGINENIDLHMHNFSEFVLIHRGSCVYQYKGNEILLVSGDVIFLPPYHIHGYWCEKVTEFYNCQFYANQLGAQWEKILKDTVSSENFGVSYDINNDNPFGWGYDLLDVSLVESDDKTQHSKYIPYLREYKVVHLSKEEKDTVENLLESIRTEQEKKESGYENLKQAFLTIILTNIKRIMEKQSRTPQIKRATEKNVVSQFLSYIEEHYAEEIDFDRFADEHYITLNYFRQLFKRATGMSPVNYLNRIRVIKSLQYIQYEQLPIAEAAAKVGIYDANYFSRMFKKIMGYSPKYFKSIEER